MSKKSNVKQFTDKLEKLNYSDMYEGDFFLTWEKSQDEIEAWARSRRSTAPG